MPLLVIAAAIFTFQNNLWVNLHQFLHAEASRKAAGRDVASGVYAAHSTISPVGQGSAGDMGVETIFHEASHAVDGAILRMIADESRRH
jgi:hypothetical protein